MICKKRRPISNDQCQRTNAKGGKGWQREGADDTLFPSGKNWEGARPLIFEV